MTLKNNKKKIVLLDSHAILHRAYHAMGDFSTRDGRPTGALYGLVTFVLRVAKEIKPDYIVACFDLPKPTFRHISYDGYKAGRKKTDDSLVTQIKESYGVCEALGIPIYNKEGFEADDILGTIASHFDNKKDYQIIIASGDMDTLQLVIDDDVVVYTLKRGNDAVTYNEKEVNKRFGFGPLLIPDYKGLAGDSSDNIVGISGIGEKTATELIKNFGTIENIYKELKKDRNKFLKLGFKERMVKLLEEGEEDALFSKTLATIRKDAPINFEVPKNVWSEGIDTKKYEAMCDNYEFRSLRHKIREVVLKEEKEEVKEVIEDEGLLEECKVMLNLLHSELTNQTAQEIKDFTGKDDLIGAKEELVDLLKKEDLLNLYHEIEEPIIPIVREMKETGIKVDVEKLKKLSVDLHKKVSLLEKEIYELAGEEFNISSPKQLGEIIYEKLGLGEKIKKTKTGAKSTGIGELEKIKDEHPVIVKIIEYRELTKLLSTYIDTLPNFVKEDGRIHAHYIQSGTGTGRFSCEDPNLQNLPVKSEFGKQIRESFVADNGKILLSCDYSQIDLRSAGILSGDMTLLDIFNKKIDVHTGTAMKIFNVSEKDVTPDMRRKAKAINFGILYGMGVTSLKEGMGVERKEAQEFYDQYKKTFSRMMEYLEEVKAYAFKNGYTKTLFGRRREIPLLKSPLSFLRAQGERIAINAPVQGTSADILKLAILDTDDYLVKNKLKNKVKLSLQIHDELVFEMDKNIDKKVIQDIVDALENVLKKRKVSDVPLVVSSSLGENLNAF